MPSLWETFVIAHKDGLVGADLADNEINHPCRPFAAVFEKMAAQGLGVTIHAGEADIEDASTQVRDAIDYLGATRIGHGLHIHDDDETVNYVKDKGVALELCPTSNWLTRAVSSLENHPFRKLFDAGVQTTINSDDPSAFNINLTREYQILSDLHHFNEEEFDRCNDNAAKVSFIPLEKKQKVWPRPLS